jgi:hypothetical protein
MQLARSKADGWVYTQQNPEVQNGNSGQSETSSLDGLIFTDQTR